MAKLKTTELILNRMENPIQATTIRTAVLKGNTLKKQILSPITTNKLLTQYDHFLTYFVRFDTEIMWSHA